jgi:hypothetical protein
MKINRAIGPAGLFLLLGISGQVYGQHEEQGKPENRAESQKRPAAPKQQQERAQQPRQQQAQPRQQAQHEQRQVQRDQKAEPRPQQERSQQSRQQVQPEQRLQPSEPQVQRAHQPVEQVRPQQRDQPQQHAQSQPSARPERTSSYTPPLRTREQARTWQQQSSWRQNGAWQEHSSWQQQRSSNWQSDHRTWAQRGGYGGYYIPQASFGLYFGTGHSFRIQSEPIIVGGYPRFQYGGYSFLMVDPWPADWAQDWYSSDDVYVDYDDGYYLYNRQHPGEAIAITIAL